jgi:hypothetical protein
MGNCFSDMEGGKQAVGGAQQRPTIISDNNNNNNGGHNDAVDFFYKSHGLHPLFTQMEVYIYIKTNSSGNFVLLFNILLFIYCVLGTVLKLFRDLGYEINLL